MPQQTSPFIEAKYGWSFGENNWNGGMDENLLKFSFMFDRNINGVVGSLPAAVDGSAYFLTTDNRLYFAVGTTWYSTETPKWFEFFDETTGDMYQFNGTTAVMVDNPASIDARLDAVELTISTLGSAAFEDSAFFVKSNELSDTATLTLGSRLVGVHERRTLDYALGEIRDVEDFGATGDGSTNDTPALQNAFAWVQAAPGRTLRFRPVTYLQGIGGTEVMYEGNPYFPARINVDNCNNITILGNGATIVADTTLTDTPFNRGIQFSNCHNLTVKDITYDGRLDARTPFGGDAFNSGNELTGNEKSGWGLYDCHDFYFSRVNGNRCMMDGLHFNRETTLTTGNLRGIVELCTFDSNYRQGSSIVAGSYTSFISCVFTGTGSLGASKGTLPMAGVDIESNFDNLPCIGNEFHSCYFSRNLDGLLFSRAAQHNVADSCIIEANRGRGLASSTNLTSTIHNIFRAGKIIQTQASSETELYAAYIGGNRTKIIDSDIRVADPHRAVVFVNLAQTVNCEVMNTSIEDVGVNGAFNQILVHFTANSANCKVEQCRILNATGASGWHAVLESTSCSFNRNRVASGHGGAGARGVDILGATRVKDNEVTGVSTASTTETAGFNIRAGAALIRELGPNIDTLNPTLSARTRRVGFAAGPFYGSATYDPPSLADGAGTTTIVTVTGAALGAGHYAQASFSNSVAGLTITADVTAANTVTVRFQNESGGILDLASGTLSAKVSL
ncbi:Pectate lyase superfamily protein [compost metagenome]